VSLLCLRSGVLPTHPAPLGPCLRTPPRVPCAATALPAASGQENGCQKAGSTPGEVGAGPAVPSQLGSWPPRRTSAEFLVEKGPGRCPRLCQAPATLPSYCHTVRHRLQVLLESLRSRAQPLLSSQRSP